ncbi:MAG: APC family permease, partial [Conexibacter sp.]
MSIDVTTGADAPADRLHHGALGVPNIVFLVLAGAAPMGAMVGALPLVVALGDGGGAPGAYLFAALALAAFAVGYAAMSRHVSNAGAFYAYIGQGLGRPAGVGAAYVAVIAYNAVVCGVLAALGAFAAPIFNDQFGIDLAWYVWSGIAFAIVALLAYRRIELSARVLGVALVIEVLILLVMDVGILLDGRASFSLTSFSPSTVFDVAPGVAFLFAFNSFIGFEATAIFSEEARDPQRTIPRATYAAIALIGVFYAFTSWCVVSFYGADAVQATATKHIDTFIFTANTAAVGSFTTDLMQIFLVTSFFAALLALHNSAARYHFALGREGVLPRKLAHTHPRYGSPVVGSAVGLVAIAIPIVAVAIAGSDPYLDLGAIALALGTIGILALQAAASFAVIGYFRRRPVEAPSPWVHTIAPAIGGVTLGAALYLGIDNWSLLTGVASGWQTQLPWIVAAGFVAGVAWALAIRRRDPAAYARLTHGTHDLD